VKGGELMKKNYVVFGERGQLKDARISNLVATSDLVDELYV
jgi:hypothetical protein